MGTYRLAWVLDVHSSWARMAFSGVTHCVIYYIQRAERRRVPRQGSQFRCRLAGRPGIRLGRVLGVDQAFQQGDPVKADRRGVVVVGSPSIQSDSLVQL